MKVSEGNAWKTPRHPCYIFPFDSDAGFHVIRLLPGKMLGSDWVVFLIIADSTVMVALVVITCVIGFPRFAISESPLQANLEDRHLPHGDLLRTIRQRFLRVLDSLSKTISARLHDECRSRPAFCYSRCKSNDRIKRMRARLQVNFVIKTFYFYPHSCLCSPDV